MIGRENIGDVTDRSTSRVSSARGRLMHAPLLNTPLNGSLLSTVGGSEEDKLSVLPGSGSASRQSTADGQYADVQKALEDIITDGKTLSRTFPLITDMHL